MAIFIILFIILICLFTTWLILKILSKKRTVESVSLENKTLDDMRSYCWQNGWDLDRSTNTAIKVNYKYNIDKIVISTFLYLWIIVASLICMLGLATIGPNILTESKQYNNKLEREKIVVRLKYYDNYGTEIYKNETALQEYTKTLEQVKDFNSRIYFTNAYKDSIWIGIFVDKGYVGLEPIEYTKL